jgi:DNA-binding MarR family transcriptional regulator
MELMFPWEDQLVSYPADLEDVYASPGHLIRRSQQISVSIFADELGEFGITSVQYAALITVRERPGLDQRSLGRVVAIDRSTVGSVVKMLEARGLVTRTTPEGNLRVKVLNLTDDGEALLAKSASAVAAVQRRLLAPLTAAEQASFLRLLSKLVEVNNTHSRAPVLGDGAESGGS